MTAIYNEIEPFAAKWLENLAAADLIAAGRVETRSIVDLQPEDVRDATQAHFFAGIGVWSSALRDAGWPDDVPVWTGSCPCQPFSSAGKGGGIDDERHLWPEWCRLIRECRPPIIFGEQVASPAGLGWLDAVSADLENAGYAVGAADLCAAGIGAPHARQRLYFVAYADEARLGELGLARLRAISNAPQRNNPDRRSASVLVGVAASGTGGLGVRGGRDGNLGRIPQRSPGERDAEEGAACLVRVAASLGLDGRRAGEARDGRDSARIEPQRSGDAERLGDASRSGSGRNTGAISRAQRESASTRQRFGRFVDVPVATGAVGGFWEDAEWVYCRDGKARPIEPGTFPLAHGVAARVGRLRATGNAIVRPLATTFIRAAIAAIVDQTPSDAK